jgi:hypothetical protein
MVFFYYLSIFQQRNRSFLLLNYEFISFFFVAQNLYPFFIFWGVPRGHTFNWRNSCEERMIANISVMFDACFTQGPQITVTVLLTEHTECNFRKGTGNTEFLATELPQRGRRKTAPSSNCIQQWLHWEPQGRTVRGRGVTKPLFRNLMTIFH